MLSELYCEEVALCERFGNARPEEGSEHYLAYCVEDLTHRGYVHGSLVGLCSVAVAKLQELWGSADSASPVTADMIAGFLKASGLDCTFKGVGVTRDEFREALLKIGKFVHAETQLLPGVFHFFGGVPEDQVDDLLQFLESSLAL